jgi:hypothetical protein
MIGLKQQRLQWQAAQPLTSSTTRQLHGRDEL